MGMQGFCSDINDPCPCACWASCNSGQQDADQALPDMHIDHVEEEIHYVHTASKGL